MKKILFAFIACLVIIILVLPFPAQASVYTVNSLLDLPDGDVTDNTCATVPPGTPVCTLRAAVMQANAHPGPDVISVPAGAYNITRVGLDSTAVLGDLDVTDEVAIYGSGVVIVDANGATTSDRAFEVITSTLTIYDLTIQNGNTPSYGGAIYASGGMLRLTNVTIQNSQAALSGGGIYASGQTIQISDSLIQNNQSQGSGGGAYFHGNTSINNTQIISNTAQQAAGGIHVFDGTYTFNLVRVGHNRSIGSLCGGILSDNGTTNISHSWVEYNSASIEGGGPCSVGVGNYRLAITDTQVLNNSAASSGGGGVFVNNSFFSTRSTIYNNSAVVGGGVYVVGLAIFENSTLSGNHVGRDGGGIYAASGSNVFLNSVTLANNLARRSYPLSGSGGGAFIESTAAFSITASILANNSGSPIVSTLFSDCSGTFWSNGFNFIGSNEGCTITGVAGGNLVGGVFPANLNPQLAPLDAIGGLTPAHLPLAGSPVIDAGTLVGCRAAHGVPLAVDQIGHNRSLNGRCDIGAVEYFPLVRAFLPVIWR